MTTGGFSPNGETVLLEAPQTNYALRGGTLRVVGLSELGLAIDPDNGVYYDDQERGIEQAEQGWLNVSLVCRQVPVPRHLLAGVWR